MSHQSVKRTAPIAIAPKPPRPEPAPYRQDTFHRLDLASASLPTGPSADSSLPPCVACRYSRVNCVLNEDEDGCIQCQVSGSDCSLTSSPQSRKRKIHSEAVDDLIGKRRSVLSPRIVPVCYSSSRPFPRYASSSPILPTVLLQNSPVRSTLLLHAP